MFITRYKIQPKDEVYFDEYMQNPSGPHSLGLQRILNLFRGCGELRYALLVIKPHKEWVLVTLHEPRRELEIHYEDVFLNLNDAEREIFRRRWAYHSKKSKVQ